MSATTANSLPTSANSGQPFVIVQFQAKDLVGEVIELVTTVREQLVSISDTFNTNLNGTLANVGTDVERIVSHVEGITGGINQQLADYHHPLVISLIFIIFLLLLVVLLFFFILKTRGEYRRHKARRNTQPVGEKTTRQETRVIRGVRQLPRTLHRKFGAFRSAMMRRRGDGIRREDASAHQTESDPTYRWRTTPAIVYLRTPTHTPTISLPSPRKEGSLDTLV